MILENLGKLDYSLVQESRVCFFEIKFYSPFQPLSSVSVFIFATSKSYRSRLYHYSHWRVSMKLDPFQAILRPHGFLRPLLCLLFLLSRPLSTEVASSTPIRTNESLFLTVRQAKANARDELASTTLQWRLDVPSQEWNNKRERG